MNTDKTTQFTDEHW